jgi:hypothetical protein
VTIQCLFEVTPMPPLTTTVRPINVRIVADVTVPPEARAATAG